MRKYCYMHISICSKNAIENVGKLCFLVIFSKTVRCFRRLQLSAKSIYKQFISRNLLLGNFGQFVRNEN